MPALLHSRHTNLRLRMHAFETSSNSPLVPCRLAAPELFTVERTGALRKHLGLGFEVDHSAAAAPDKSTINEGFPTQSPDLAREMVKLSHFDLNRVQRWSKRSRRSLVPLGTVDSAIGKRRSARGRTWATGRSRNISFGRGASVTVFRN